MAALTAAQITQLHKALMRHISRNQETASFTKAQYRAAIVEADAWLDANATSYNNSLSQPFRGSATITQKAIILAAVALIRTGNVELLRAAIGDTE